MIYSIIILFFVIFIFIGIVDITIKHKKIILFNDLKVVYNNMEMFAISNKLTPTNSLLDFLKSYKFLLENKEFADVRIFLGMRLLSSADNLKSNKDKLVKIKKEVPVQLIEYSEHFNSIYDKLIKLSYLNFSFMWFIFKMAFRYAIYSLINSSKEEAGKVFHSLKEMFNNEYAVASALRKDHSESELEKLCF